MTADNSQHDRSSSSLSSAPAASTANPFRQPTAFAAAPTPTPNPTTSQSSSSGPTFSHYKDKTKTPIPGHVTALSESVVDATGSSTSMLQFSVEGYVNTPELSAGRGGGLSQGLAANGPYRSLFRAGPRSESRASASNHHKINAAITAAAAAATAPTSSLHVLAEAAQSPEAQSPISATASPRPTHYSPVPAPTSVPVPTSKTRSRKPSPLIESMSPPPISATRASPVASTNASSSSPQPHIVIDSSPPSRHPRAKPGGGGSSATTKGKQREVLTSEAPVNGNAEGSEQRFERGLLPSGRQQRPGVELHEPESGVQDRLRNVQKDKNWAASSKEVSPIPQAPPAPADHLSYDHAEGDYFPSSFEAEPSGASVIACEAGQSLGPSQATTSTRTTTGEESALASMADSLSVTPGTKPRMITLLIEDRRHGTDELAEVHVPLKTIGEGYLWADAKDVCVALQSGPSRIDGAFTRC